MDASGFHARAICNGRKAGHGQPLAPQSYINDGLLDVLIVKSFPLIDASKVMTEFRNQVVDGAYVHRFQISEAVATSEKIMPLNLDGEPYKSDRIAFRVLPGVIKMVLFENCPCLKT